MILKNLFNLFNLISFTALIIIIYVINTFILEVNIRKKFFLFLIIFFIFLSIGLYYNLDGIVLLFTISELSVLLIFITMFSQIYSYSKNGAKINSIIFFTLIIIINFQYYEINLITYTNFYSFYNINLNDFYYIYNYYFEKQILLTILVIMLITLYSIFFIILYFNIKKKQNIESSKNKQFNLLRKQNIIHQSNYNTNIRNFQK